MFRKIGLATLNLILIAASVFAPLIPTNVAKADTLIYNHIIPFTITDTSGVSRTNVPVIITYDTSGKLVAYGLVNATATDTYVDSSGASNSPVGSGTSYDFLVASSNITAVIPSLPAYGSVTLNLYTGTSPGQTTFPIITGNNGYVTTASAIGDTDQPGDNFSMEWAGHLDTSSTWTNPYCLNMNGASNAYAWKNAPTDIKHAAGSVELWVQLGTVANTQHLFAFMTGGATTDEWRIYYVTGTGQINVSLLVAGVASWAAHGTATITDTKAWHQILVTSDGSTVKLYIDGAPDTLVTTVGANTGQFTDDAANANAIVFGILKRAAVILPYTGLMNEVRFYNRALSATEAANHYTGLGISNTDLGLLDLWRMNEGTGATTANTANGTATSNTLTLVATGWAQSTLNMGMPSLVSKPGAIWVANSGSGNVTVQIMNSSANVTATGVASGEHTVIARANGTLGLFEVLVDTSNLLWNSSYEIGNPPTGWTLTGAGATVSRSAVQAKVGTYSALLTRNVNDCTFYQSLSNPTYYSGRTVTFGSWVYATVASRAEIYIQDSASLAYSSFHSGVAGWEWLTATKTITAANLVLYTQELITGGDTSAYFDGAKLVEGTTCTPDTYPVATVALGGASVPDNADNWTFLQGNVAPRTDYIKETVGGTQQLWYEPTAMISGAVLPDRATATVNDGTITWGTNTGMTITGGDIMTSNSATSVGTTSMMMQANLFYMGTYASVYLGFQYGLDTTYGYWTSESAAAAPQTFSVTLTGLTPNTTYHYRAVARSGVVYSYGMDITVTTGYSTSSMGSTSLLIITAGVFQSYAATGDWLFTAEIIDTYPPYYPTKDPKQYFQMQLLGTDNTTILGASPIVQWGDRPESISLSATANVTYGAAYTIRVISIATGVSANTTYPLAATDWKGDDLTKLDDWCIGVATNMQNTDGNILTNPYLTVVTGHGVIITNDAGGYFTNGIHGIAQARPTLFSTAEHKNIIPTLSPAITNPGGTLAGKVGATIAGDAQTVGNILNLSGQQLLLYMILGVVLLCMVFTVSSAQGFGALGAILLAVPIMGASVYSNILGISMLVALAIILAVLFVRQIVIKTL